MIGIVWGANFVIISFISFHAKPIWQIILKQVQMPQLQGAINLF